ncbi:MAG: glutamine--fructose-6-phosphate transaminase (isomerizing) [Candidatus Micrarchaeota archaeon]|nr:glutamine--fructose-6-phosphate transaminase (isomerizing) [Candidatus Micrarchaeota archaeon]
MCGIVGYIGEKQAAAVIYECLGYLDYRGYDSAGIATVENEKLHLKKDAGRLHDIEKKMSISKLPGTMGMGHTRWATHGVPNMVNAHPHTDSKNEFCLVHNGVIENFRKLKEEVESAGITPVSDTDSELIVHVIQNEYSKCKNAEEAVRRTIAKLQGSFALVIMHISERKLFLARNGSPLVIGFGNGEMFCASDVPALLHHTKRFTYLEENDFAVLTKEGIRIENKGKQVERKPVEIKWTAEMARKEGYKHFTLKEINEQPEALRETCEQDLGGVVAFAKKFRRIHIVACGTSYHAGLTFKYLVQKHAKIPCEVTVASEYSYAEIVDKDELILAISQSGETADTLSAVRRAKGKGMKILALTNVVGSSLNREADMAFYTHAGPEISVVATKTFTSQVAALAMLAFGLSGEKKMEEEVRKAPEFVKKILEKQGEMEKLAEKLMGKEDFFFIGRALAYPTAMEGALKLKEITYLHAEAYPAGELKHGPLSLLEKGVPIIAVAPSGETASKMIGNIGECKARSATILALSDDDEVLAEADIPIKMPPVPEPLVPIVYVVPLQLLAYHLAVLMKLDPDKPRNLAKSVTVE